MVYIIQKKTRSYRGGPGRFGLEFYSIDEALKAAERDGNPVGFDVYKKCALGTKYQDPVASSK